jgi:CRP-like cAMP-binding protein
MIVHLEPRTTLTTVTAETSQRNWLLARMEPEDREALERAGKPVKLAQGNILFEPEDEVHHVWFVHSGAISMVTVMADGSAVESLMIGREGVTETAPGAGRKWLLNSHDRAGTEILPLTQEFLGDMLGAQRTTVTAVASALQKTGAISYKRGRITVLDRPALERASCECYAAAQRRARAAARAV